MGFRIGFQVRALSNMIKKRIDHLSRETGLTGFQGYLLGYLIEESKTRDIFQRDVEKKMEISRASVTSVLQLLEKNGFIIRELVEGDARLKKIVVTEKGKKANEQIRTMLDGMEESLKEGIAGEDLQVFMDSMQHIKENLERMEEE